MGHFDILIIGGGAAGIAAARAAADAGCKSIALVERKQKLGGILLQCSHPGFGAGLTGGEYAAALVQDFPETVTLFFGTTVLSVEPNKTAHLSGDRQISFSQLILATGSREIPLGALPIAGTRPKGCARTAANSNRRLMTSSRSLLLKRRSLSNGSRGLIQRRCRCRAVSKCWRSWNYSKWTRRILLHCD